MSAIDGPLNAEVTGRPDAPVMLFAHPNPLDGTGWLYQTAHFSTWYRCIAVDLPGYGRSPGVAEGVTMRDVAQACWDAVDRHGGGGPAVLVGCSVGGNVVQHMYHLRPEQTDSLVLSGSGWRPVKDFAQRRIQEYTTRGLDYRYDYALEDVSAAFRAQPLARYFARMFAERNHTGDLTAIVRVFRALAEPDPEWLQRDLHAPVLLFSGSEDFTHKPALALAEQLPDVELFVIQGAGHACQLEVPWVFDAQMIRFLRAHGHTHLPQDAADAEA